VRSLAIAVLAIAAPCALPAQDTAATQNPCDRPVSMRREDSQFPMMGLRFGSPLRVSAYYGWWWRPVGRNTPCEQNLWVSTAEVGVGGAQMNFGFQHGKGGMGNYVPMRLQASLLQTFEMPGRADRWRLYAGAEAQCQIFWGLRFSAFQPLTGRGRGHFVAWSVLLGF
jgi:hypothetical protein